MLNLVRNSGRLSDGQQLAELNVGIGWFLPLCGLEERKSSFLWLPATEWHFPLSESTLKIRLGTMTSIKRSVSHQDRVPSVLILRMFFYFGLGSHYFLFYLDNVKEILAHKLARGKSLFLHTKSLLQIVVNSMMGPSGATSMAFAITYT